MPVYDLTCPAGHEQLDILLKLGERPPCPTCGGPTETLWRGGSSVISDECDVWIRHGICETDGSPKRYTSKTDMRREAEKRGLTNNVRHVGEPGSDKSRHTSRWV